MYIPRLEPLDQMRMRIQNENISGIQLGMISVNKNGFFFVTVYTNSPNWDLALRLEPLVQMRMRVQMRISMVPNYDLYGLAIDVKLSQLRNGFPYWNPAPTLELPDQETV